MIQQYDIQDFGSSIPIPERQLRDFGKSIGIIFRSRSEGHGSSNSTKWVGDVLQSLFATVYSPSLSVTHQVAAINALCGCLDQCTDSAADNLQKLVCSSKVYDDLYRVCFEHADGMPVKSLKHLTSTLIKVLAKSVEISGNSGLIDRTCETFFDVLYRSKDRSKAKPVLVALTLFLSRSLFNARHLSQSYGSYRRTILPTSENFLSNEQAHFRALLNLILQWVSIPDLAPAAGHLVSTLLSGVSGSPLALNDGDVSRGDSLPVWVEPVMCSLRDDIQALQGFKNHAFPALFRISPSDYWKFLIFLGVDKLSMGRLIPPEDDTKERFSQDLKCAVLFAVLQTGRSIGIVRIIDRLTKSPIEYHKEIVWVSLSILSWLCGCSSTAAQLAGISLLIISPHSTQPFTAATIRCIKRHIPHFHAEPDATTRSEIASATNKLINRLRAVTCNIVHKIDLLQRSQAHLQSFQEGKSTESLSDVKELSTVLESHQNFLHWLLSFSISELHPNASYQRHILALKAILCMVKSGLDISLGDQSVSKHGLPEQIWPFHLRILNESLRRSLFDLLLDPFDEVRQITLELLKFFSAEDLNNIVGRMSRDRLPKALNVALRRAENAMIASGRLDHADGVARFYGLLSVLRSDDGPSHIPGDDKLTAVDVLEQLTRSVERSVKVAKVSMHEAVGKHSIHGIYTALRYVLEEIASSRGSSVDRNILNPILLRISNSFLDTWETVHYLLCNDAPEGFVPEDMEDEPELTTKDALSYAWRALRESSLVLRSIVMLNLHEDGVANSKPPLLSLEYLGDLCFTQLAELRHRGTISTVAQTFAVVCQHCGIPQKDKSEYLIKKWYERALVLIGQRGSAITRRSAGIPAIMTALVGADPDGSLFATAVAGLSDMSKISPGQHGGDGVTNLPQVHALNSLRGLFTTSRLGSQSEPFVSEVLGIAAGCINSDTWAIRNCGLMLFRSLVDRLLGSDESENAISNNRVEHGARMSYDSHPRLLDFLEQFLLRVQVHKPSSTAISSPAEALFPVLDLLRRAPPPENRRMFLSDLVLTVTSSASWHIRDIAARTFAAFAPVDKIQSIVETLLAVRVSERNQLHGHLLCVRYLIKAVPRSKNLGDTRQLLMAVVEGRDQVMNEKVDEINRALYVDIINEFGLSIFGVANFASEDTASLMTLYATTLHQQVPKSYRSRSAGPLYPLLGQAEIMSTWIFQLMKSVLRDLSEEASIDPAIDSLHSVELLLHDARGTDEALKTLCDRLGDKSTRPLRALLGILANVLGTTLAGEVRAAIERAFMEVLQKLIHVVPIVDDLTIYTALAKSNSWENLRTEQAPSVFESTISIWGCTLASRFRVLGSESGELVEESRSWIRCTRTALDERNEFPLRYAAALSLLGFSIMTFGSPGLPESVQPSLIFAVYDTLRDDDDEIRALGASIIPFFLIRSGSSRNFDLGVTPPLAAKMVCVYLVESFGTSVEVVTDSLNRLTGHVMGTNFDIVSATETLHAAINKASVLFNEEKPNLYIDPVGEADIWCCVLKRCSVHNCPQALLDSFTAWVSEGLDALLSTTRSQMDGPLGWTSKPDVFALGMRVLSGAEVLLEWRTKSREITIKGSVLRKKLRGLADAGVEMDVHGQWLEKIERMLNASVEKRLSRVRDVLLQLPVSVR